MPIDWTTPDFVFLRRQLELGRVVLFAGAGFSLGARNRHGEAPPLGNKLAEQLALQAGLPYKGDPLPQVYEATIPIIGGNRLWAYLSELYTVERCADWYQKAASVTWHRIYTTNIDTLFQHIAPYGSRQRLKTVVRGEPAQERDQLFEELQCIHLHGHVEHRVNGLSFSPADFARHTARPDPWYQNLADDIQNCPVLFIGTTLDEPILNHYLELRDPKDPDKKEWRPKSFLVSPNISEIKAAALRNRNIHAISVTAEEFFDSLFALPDLPLLDCRSVQARAYPHHFAGGAAIGRAVNEHFDLIVPNQLPTVRTTHPSRFFLGAEPTWNDIGERRDGDRAISQSLIGKLASDTKEFACLVLIGPAGSGKTTCIMRVANELSAQGHQVFFARGSHRLDLNGILDVLEKDTAATHRVFLFIDVVSQHIGSIMNCRERLKESNRLTLILIDRSNRYATKCGRIEELSPDVVPMPDLAEPDVRSILQRLEHFGFLGALKDKSHEERVRLFMERASRQLLVAMREATSGKDFALILQGEFEELVKAAQLAYTICCIAVSRGAPGVYTKHLSPCLPISGFAKGAVIDELLRGVLVPSNDAGTMVKPRHGLIARWVAHEIAPIELRLEALRTFLKQVSSHINPSQIRQRSPAFLAYRGMINSEGLKELLDGNTAAILDLYEELRPFYANDFLFWLHFGMAHIDGKNLDHAENCLNQSLALYPNSHQTLNHLGILYLLQARDSLNPAAGQTKASEGMRLLMEQIRGRGDYDAYPYHAYLTHVSRWYMHAGNLIPQEDWEALRKVGTEARAKHRMDDGIRAAADEVEFSYLRRLIKAESPPPA